MSVSKVLKQKLMTIDNNLDEIKEILNDVLGEKTDYVPVPYEGGNSIYAFLQTGYYHIHGKTFVYPLFAGNVILTSAAGIWNNTGTITEVVPANALSYDSFDIHWINIYAISANCAGVIEIFKGLPGAETIIGVTRIARTTNFTQEGSKYIQIPQQLVNERISCRLTTNVVGSIQCAISFEGHYYKI